MPRGSNSQQPSHFFGRGGRRSLATLGFLAGGEGLPGLRVCLFPVEGEVRCRVAGPGENMPPWRARPLVPGAVPGAFLYSAVKGGVLAPKGVGWKLSRDEVGRANGVEEVAVVSATSTRRALRACPLRRLPTADIRPSGSCSWCSSSTGLRPSVLFSSGSSFCGNMASSSSPASLISSSPSGEGSRQSPSDGRAARRILSASSSSTRISSSCPSSFGRSVSDLATSAGPTPGGNGFGEGFFGDSARENGPREEVSFSPPSSLDISFRRSDEFQ
mmetsp:Transcript_43878/g.103207  ORF Transcript_43878/g.103207 Transcript_43878/m.103207 type:complete len:273 (+) Transcript_43878:77-895(+)